VKKSKLPFRIRNSKIAGRGAFATRRIRKGQQIIEYVGERITEKESDRRYPDDDKMERHHTFLFAVEGGMVIDASFGGNEARFINHSCDPNCDAIEEDGGRIFIEANRTIQPGEELAYDYQYARDPGDGPEEEAVYPCHCGSPKCRGTIMEPRKRRRKKKPAKGAKRKTKRGARR
jgi:hypothetical protein